MQWFDYLTSLLVQLGAAILMGISALTGFAETTIPSGIVIPPIQISTSESQPLLNIGTTTLLAPASANTTAVAKNKTSTTKTSLPVSINPSSPIVSKPTPPVATIDPATLNTQVRSALVNILCTTKYGGYFEPISGSGVFIDSRGVILTNAHVAQFFLLQNYLSPNSVDCAIRMGSPAQSLYRATLLYLPPAWITAHASQITESHATGTGEDDYALLLVTGSTNPSTPLPSSFPFLPMTGSDPDTGDSVLLAAYPAGFLGGTTIQMNLYVTSAFATVGQLFSFDTTPNVDVISVGGTVVSQSGSSGGAVVNATDGELTGIISTDTDATSTAQRDLRAITLSYINRSMTNTGLGGLAGFLSQNLSTQAALFASSTAPSEAQKLEQAISKTSN